jgi:hypothetical protein
MVGIAEASAALSGLKTAYDMAKGVSALTTDANTKLATIDLMQTILAAQQHALASQEAQAALMKRITELESRLAERDSWDTERSRYILTEFSTGVQAYTLKPEFTADGPAERLCANCFDQGRRSLLQTYSRHSGGEAVQCQRCDAKMNLSSFAQRRIVRDRDRYD